MSSIRENIESIRQKLPAGVKLVAVSKTRPASDIMVAYNAGQRVFGENRAMELASKKSILPGDIEWHLIGHLQTNKVKTIISFVSLIESVDSLRLLRVIDTEAGKCGRVADCLLQFHIASEETKFGFSLAEAEEMLTSADFISFRNIRICGVMGMATFTDDSETVSREFGTLAGYFSILSEKYFSKSPAFRELSMGMSGDYLLAVAAGSTMVRIGSLIFGERKVITPLPE
jgi:PLP dependent protein